MATAVFFSPIASPSYICEACGRMSALLSVGCVQKAGMLCCMHHQCKEDIVMDAESCGELIRKLRKEAGLTQRELADRLCVTDKAVSKWERGMGCPDISMLGALTREFRVDIESLLSGALPQRPKEGGNMKRVCFAICPSCGNLFTASAPAQVCCCGRKLDFPAPTPADQAHLPHMEQMEDELCFTFDHPMTKEHHLNFVALITFDRMIFVRLYPEQDPLVRMPYVRTGTLVYGCTQHGLMSADIRKL